jgi:hypothetical protein
LQQLAGEFCSLLGCFIPHQTACSSLLGSLVACWGVLLFTKLLAAACWGVLESFAACWGVLLLTKIVAAACWGCSSLLGLQQLAGVAAACWGCSSLLGIFVACWVVLYLAGEFYSSPNYLQQLVGEFYSPVTLIHSHI